MKTWASVALLAAVALLAGCTASPAVSSGDPAARTFAEIAEGALADAKATGATDEQIAIIEEVVANGEVTYESVQAAVESTYACFDAAGIRYDALAPRMKGDIAYPQYAFEGEGGSEVADACIHANSDYVEALYARQPAAVAASDQEFIAAMPVLIDCLEDLGYEIPADATMDEVKQVLVIEEEDIGTPREQEALERFACVREAGITSY